MLESMDSSLESNFLPDQYRFAHDYCFFLHDALANIVVQGEHARIFHHHFELQDPTQVSEIEGKSGEELAAWLEQNGYEAEYHEGNRRHICVALLSDFCHYVYEALKCSQKGKLTVTFTLLRKPLKENLFYFEWMLADLGDFLERFHTPAANTTQRALPLPTELSKERRLSIIETAIRKTSVGVWIPPEFIYELRYDKNCDYGFEQLFQRATHLITTIAAQTEDHNFNFIFSDDDDRQSQWQGLYTLLPALLLHSLIIIHAVIRGFDEDKLEDFEFLILRAQIGFLLYIDQGPWKSDIEEELVEYTQFLTEAKLQCLGCLETLTLDVEDLYALYYEGVVKCHQCGYKTLLTTNSDTLMLSHLMQEQVVCPSCNTAVEANEENLSSYFESKKVICQQCQAEIRLGSFGEN